MGHSMSRRTFLGAAAGAGWALGWGASAARGANEKIVVAIVGASRAYGAPKNPGRGATLALGVAQLPGAEVAYVCDVDRKNQEASMAEVAAKQSRAPKGVSDFRRVLDDKSVDALVIATPDHWHTPAGILGCQAGKHVYVEKPCSHNAREGELLVAAARKYGRVVQHGTQRRSWPSHQEAIRALREGAIGRVLSAQCYYRFSDRPTIGHGKPGPVPETLDWSLWQGPAPEREFRDNYLHYNWHWFWNWGTAELGNNGVHTIDVARWGLGAEYPRLVHSMGGRLRYDDDQETPDTSIANFQFDDGRMITWEQRSWGGKTFADPTYQIGFFGDQGTLTISGTSYAIHDRADQEVAKGNSVGGDAVHLQNFCDAIRGSAKLNAEIEEGMKSTLMCHLGNISQRTGRTIRFDPATRTIVNDKEASGMWGREYRPGWEPKV
jgi:predicted dehydrogenase